MSDNLWAQAIGMTEKPSKATAKPDGLTPDFAEMMEAARQQAKAELSSEAEQIKSGGFDETKRIARELAEQEFKARAEQLKAEAVDNYIYNNTQRPMQSRTNKALVGAFIATGLRIGVEIIGLPGVFAEPVVAEAVGSVITGGLEAVAIGFGGLAMKFRNAATKFIR